VSPSEISKPSWPSQKCCSSFPGKCQHHPGIKPYKTNNKSDDEKGNPDIIQYHAGWGMEYLSPKVTKVDF
jgi:hypothetical protein